MMVRLLALFLILFPVVAGAQPLSSQLDSSIEYRNSAVWLNEVTVVSREFKTPGDKIIFEDFKEKVMKVYPYALLGKQVYKELKEKEASVQKKKEYRKFKKNIVKSAKEEFREELKNLTVSEGKILVKLLNRETGNNCYAVIKEIKGGAAAWFWQQIAKKWDYDLKAPYDPDADENADLELILSGLKNFEKIYCDSTALYFAIE